MAAWQPVLSPPWVIALFLIVFIVFTPLGVFILLATFNVNEIYQDYTYSCNMTNQLDVNGNPDPTRGFQCIALINFTIETRMDPPVYFYYGLNNYYQNHRRYASSRDDYQLQGYQRGYSDVYSNCYPIIQYSSNQKFMEWKRFRSL